MGWFGVVRGHPRSLKIVPIDMAYEFLLAFHCNYDPILYRFWDIARYWSKIADRFEPTQPLFGAPFGGDHVGISHQITKIPGLSIGVVCVMLGLDSFVELRLVTGRQTDRQTGRRTHDNSIYRASIASRGKSRMCVYACLSACLFLVTYAWLQFLADLHKIAHGILMPYRWSQGVSERHSSL